METDPRRWISVLRASLEHLRALMGPLSPEARRADSYADEWTVAQVVAHLGSQAEIFELFLDAALAGKEPPDRDAFPPIWDVWNDKTPEDQVTDGVAANDAFIARLESLSEAELGSVRISLFGRELDACGLVRMRLVEHAIHTWDIEVGFDPGAEILPDAVALLVDALPDFAQRLGKVVDHPVRLHVTTHAPDREFALLVGDHVELVGWTDQTTNGSLELPAAAMLRLIYGRLDEMPASEAAFTADDVTFDDLLNIFPGF